MVLSDSPRITASVPLFVRQGIKSISACFPSQILTTPLTELLRSAVHYGDAMASVKSTVVGGMTEVNIAGIDRVVRIRQRDRCGTPFTNSQ
mgnify:CR=1 FL=1